jgi:hypothetical protein
VACPILRLFLGQAMVPEVLAAGPAASAELTAMSKDQ